MLSGFELYPRWVPLIGVVFHCLILLHAKFLQFDWLRAVVFQLNLKYLRVKLKPFAGTSINK